MAKKQTKKGVTIDELAMMVQRGFQSLREEMQKGFKWAESSFDRHGRRMEYHDDEIIEIKGRLQAVEKKIGIKSR